MVGLVTFFAYIFEKNTFVKAFTFGTVTLISPSHSCPPYFPELLPVNAFIKLNSVTLLMPVMQQQITFQSEKHKSYYVADKNKMRRMVENKSHELELKLH